VESSQEVTWAISSGNVLSGTEIGPNTGELSIASAEPANSTFTVTATSTTDTAKSGSVTVTVIRKGAVQLSPPTNVTLSAAGVATWDAPSGGETGVESYSVQLYKDAGALGSAETVNQGGSYSVNFLSAMRGGGVGSYTVKVKALGDGEDYSDSVEAASGSQAVSQASQVVYTWWVDPTVAHWDLVTGAGNATDYTVNVYRNSTKVADTTGEDTYNEGAKAYVDLASFMTTPGSYTFGVVTKGDNYLVLDAAEMGSAAKAYDIQLSAPANLIWSGTTAQWDAVANAAGYEVQLYKGGTASGTAQSVGAGVTSYDFDSNVSAAGLYTFTVIAKGTTTGTGDYLDSAAADSGATAGDDGKLRVGGTAAITLTASEEWNGTLEASGNPATIAKSDGALTISVSGSTFSSFVWIVDGAVLNGETTSSITLNGSAYSLGGHSVTVYALDANGAPWSPATPIQFTVTAN
jgi:hypothetical protein